MTELDTSGLDALAARVRRLSDVQTGELLGLLGDEVLDETRYRIRISEAGPDGTPYPALTRRYAERTANPSDFLQDSDAFLRSLHAIVAGDEVDVGSALPYASSLQSARTRARPYLGIGEDDVDELELIAATFLAAALTGEARGA